MTAPAVARFCGGNPDGAWETLNVQVLLLRDFRCRQNFFAIESELFCADPRFNYSKRGAICSRDSGNILSFLSSTAEIFTFTQFLTVDYFHYSLSSISCAGN
jgi:hypothetical protein